MSTLRGQRVARIELHIPPSGGWFADVMSESGAAPAPGAATLQLADLTLEGFVLPGRGGLDAPDMPSAVVVGGAGWRSLLTIEGRYSSPVGVRLSTVLRDLAVLAGEPYDAPAEAILGQAYEWSASTATAPLRVRDVLADLVLRGAIPTWRVASSGRTLFTPWPALGAADAAVRVTSRSLGRGVRYVGLDTQAAALLPGATLEGVPIARTIFHEDGGEHSAEVWDA